MTREIKFRGWFESIYGSKMWVYGYLVKQSNGNWEITDGNTSLTVENVGQFTGLTDKNGTEIYEGDILQLEKRFFYNDETEQPEKHKDLVFVKTESMVSVKCYYCDTGNKWDNGWSYSEWSDDWSDDLSEVTVIGNIYENPELINAKNNPQ